MACVESAHGCIGKKCSRCEQERTNADKYQKTKFLEPKDPGDLTDVWEGREMSRDLDEILYVSPEPDFPQMVDSEALDKALDFGYGIMNAWKQRVFSIRTVLLNDACIIGFKFLHSLCDANGKSHRTSISGAKLIPENRRP
jgi:hypothetical protein